MPIYTYADLKSKVNGNIKGKIGVLLDARATLNAGVREVVSDIDLSSTRRRAQLTPKLFSNVFEYAAPADIKGNAIVGIQDQTDRRKIDYQLVTAEEFQIRRDQNIIALDDSDNIKKILVNVQVNDKSLTIAALDSVNSGGGTWTVDAAGGATNLVADSDDFVRENGSLSYDLSAVSSTTAGIKNTALNTFDLTDYLGGNGAVFVWAHITSVTNLSNFILKIGNNTSDYYPKTITTASDGTAFRNGWNLLRFDLTSLTATGTVTATTCTYVELYMTKTVGKISETKYRFDGLYLKKGEINNVTYYSKYGWQTSGGTYIENSTVDSDYLNADTDEYDLIVAKCTELAGDEVDEVGASDKSAKKYEMRKKVYGRSNPSTALTMIGTYADFIKQ